MAEQSLTAGDARALGFIPERLARIGDYVEARYLDTGRLPHAALLVGRGDEIAHLWTSGVDSNAIFRIASMTKPVTSIACMQLVEQGALALSEPVAKYLPELANVGVYVAGGGAIPYVTRPPASPIRVIDLLRHTSGFTYSFQERTPVDAGYRKSGLENWQNVDDAGFLTELAKLPLDFDPGTRWNYSVSTDVLGVLVSRLSGMPLGDYFDRHILGPLGMADTHFAVPADKAGRLPDCYTFDPANKMRLIDKGGADSGWAGKHRFQSGGGGLASTLADYHRFCRMLLNGGTLDDVTIIGRKTLDLMTANHLPGGGDLTQHSKSLFSEAEMAGIGFGLGFACNIDPAATMLAGSAGEFYWGGMFSTAFLVDPEEDLTMVFMTQLSPSSTYPIRRELRTMIYAALAA